MHDSPNFIRPAKAGWKSQIFMKLLGLSITKDQFFKAL